MMIFLKILTVLIILGSNARRSCAIVEVQLNQATTAPFFALTSATKQISEKAVSGSVIYQASVAGNRDDVLYKYNTAKTGAATISEFVLAEASGVLTLSSNTTLDYESQAKFDLYIFAVASNNQLLESNEFHLTIQLVDVNDNSPKFSTSQYNFTVRENSAIGTSIGRVSASDADGTTTNNRITYYLLDQSNDVFNIDRNTGVIDLAGNVDREKREEYAITVCATDNVNDNTEIVPAAEQRSDCTLVRVNILDVQEGVPELVNQNYRVHLPVNITKDTIIFQFRAKDADNTPVFFEYADQKAASPGGDAALMPQRDGVQSNDVNDHSIFVLDRTTGIVRVNVDKLASVDSRPMYHLRVVPVDSVSGEKGKEVILYVHVYDPNYKQSVDDFHLVFTQSLYTMKVFENSQIGRVVGFVSAKRSDTGSNVDVVYKLMKSQYSDLFKVLPATGGINVGKELNYEDGVKSYTLTVCASLTVSGTSF